MAQQLSDNQLNDALENRLDGWKVEEDKLKKTFKFANFKESMSFMVRLSYEAEAMMHHPELFNVFNTVDVALTTHDVGGKVTEKDVELAEKLDALYKQS